MASDLQRFKCRKCAKTFNALSGTWLAHLHLRGKWIGQAEAMRDGLSLKQVEVPLGRAHDTALCFRHHFLATPKFVQGFRYRGVA
jgi:transposase-like protein